MTKRLYEDARITATDSEMNQFYNKYVKTLKLGINGAGEFCIEMAD